MNANFKKTVCLMLALLTLGSALSGCKSGNGNNEKVTDEASEAVTTTVSETTPAEEIKSATLKIRKINKYGTIILETTFDEMKEYNIEVGDIVTVSVNGQSYDMPVGTSYSDVDSGSMLCRFDTEDSEVGVAINMGSFATETGAAEKKTIEEDPGYEWDIKIEEITLALKEKNGYMDEYTVRNLSRTDERNDYSGLTDEEFANFRAVATTGIKKNFIYRSSTPVEPAIGRNEYAMAAMEKAGIKSVLNLDDDVATMESYETYADSYYSGCEIINPEMLYDFTSDEFGEKIKECVEFILECDGPILIHCKEGKDRTGILCAILECYMGGSVQEIVDDYMLTYKNYYGVEQGSETYNLVLTTNFAKNFAGIYKTENPLTTDLKEKATEFLLSTGLTEEQLEALTVKLGDGDAEQNKAEKLTESQSEGNKVP